MSVEIKAVGKLNDLRQMAGLQRMTLDIYGNSSEEFEELKDDIVDIRITPHRKKRSISANALCWSLCSEIGSALQPPIPKEVVYRKAIREVGVCETILIRDDALEAFQRHWATKGIGWFAELIDDAMLRGYVEVFAYAGSSTYDSKQMSILIDYLLDEAKQMELKIAFKIEEIQQIKDEWAREIEARNR